MIARTTIQANSGAIIAPGRTTFDAPIVLGDLTLASATTETTVGAAGGGSALPATPIGYVIINIGTTPVKFPYYNL